MATPMKLKTTYTLEFETTGQKWIVPEDCLKEVDDEKWIKIGSTRYGFIKLALGGKISSVKNPTLANCEAWKSLLEQRNQKSVMACHSLFGMEEDDGNAMATKKRKKPSASSDAQSTLSLELPDGHGVLTARRASKTNEDLMIPLEVGQICILCTYLNATVNATDFSQSSNRDYQRSGKFCGVAKARARKQLGAEDEADLEKKD